MIKKRINVAAGHELADLVLKNGEVINVFTMDTERADVAICDGVIVGVGEYHGIEEVDCTGKYIAPGFIDGHIHLESSMMQPEEFARAVLPHGTTAVVTDPHEIANVCGRQGIDYMLKATKDLPLDVYFVLPSCVPAAALDESGACLEAEDLKSYYQDKRVLGLAEMMNYIGTVNGDEQVLQKITDAVKKQKIVDGHAPGLSGQSLCAYLTAGVQSDHECSEKEEALERIRRGQWVMIREGTAAKNLEALIGLFDDPYCHRAMLVTDDKHPGDLIHKGHIDYIIRKAVSLGADPIKAIKMASFNAAQYFNMKKTGAIVPDFTADLVILSDLKAVTVESVYKQGRLVAGRGKAITFEGPALNSKLRDSIYHTFNLKALTEENFRVRQTGTPIPSQLRAISLQPGQLLTDELTAVYLADTDGIVIEKDIIKLAVIERHLHTGHIGLGYIHGYGLKKGAIASSVAHDSHNLIVAGCTEADMAAAANEVRKMQGGWAISVDGQITARLPLPAAGLMSDLDVETLAAEIHKLKETAINLGCTEGIDPFMTLAFVSLPVIPSIKMTTYGLVDVDTQKILDVVF